MLCITTFSFYHMLIGESNIIGKSLSIIEIPASLNFAQFFLITPINETIKLIHYFKFQCRYRDPVMAGSMNEMINYLAGSKQKTSPP